MIEFQKVSVKRANNRGINEVSFKIKSGRFVYLMGPTGAGKSTIIKSIQKSINIDSGKIIVFNRDISNFKNNTLAEYRRNIGMIFQDFKLLNDRSVFENIALPLQIIGIKYDEINLLICFLLIRSRGYHVPLMSCSCSPHTWIAV